MRVLGIIPARGGSKAIPGKNVADLAGVPLLAWTAAAAAGSTLTRCVLSTDDPTIADVGRNAGLDVPFQRPAELATDSASSLDVALHALEAVEAEGDDPYDAVMLLQPTTPFRTCDDIDAAIALLADSGADSVISVVNVAGHHPARMKRIDGDRLIDPPYAEAVENQPRQELEPLFIRNGAIYLTSATVLRTRSFRGHDARAYIMSAERSINIDAPLDLLIARTVVSEGLVPSPRTSGP